MWLDSGKPEGSEGRFDVLTAMPSAICETQDTNALIQTLNQALHKAPADSDLPFCGGWIGLISYEFTHPSFGLNQDLPWPAGRACFGWYDWAIIQDHQKRVCHLFFTEHCPANIRQDVGKVVQQHQTQSPATFACAPFATDESKEHYLQNLITIKDYILAGDCYQVNYTQRFSAAFEGSAAAAYLALRRATPNPYSAYLSLNEHTQVLSLSQERFIQLEGRRAVTNPIKGTAARGATGEEDRQFKDALLKSEKNRAENLMIVDLLRNDFSQHCLPHSVKTPQLFALKTYANVHHLVSTVTGELKPGVSHSEFILSCFPGGSITGAPKKRAMQVIDQLEQHPRSAYCGAIGYFSSNGKSDFNISIRTLLRQHDQIHCWAGGGIVADSVEEQEYEETLHKVGVLLKTLETAS